jgi:oligopeptide/dipeptide ABC transporter ATP-binding protein
MTALVTARELVFRYPGQEAAAVDGVDVEVEPGGMLGIVGESGSGKTTLGRLLVGALEPTAGVLEVEGRAWSAIKRQDPTRRRVQMIFQDPYGSLNPWRSARQAVAEVLRVWGETGSDAQAGAEQLLSEVGLSREEMNRTPRQLSGGQCQRVGIARALAAEPAILVADEPSSSLDVSVQAQILNLLLRLREERNLALVLISHDLAIVRYATEHALVMYAGKVLERGATADLLSDPRHPYTRILVDAIPGREGPLESVTNEVHGAGGCVFAPNCPFVSEQCLAEQPRLVGRPDREFACVLGLPASANGHQTHRDPLIAQQIGER